MGWIPSHHRQGTQLCPIQIWFQPYIKWLLSQSMGSGLYLCSPISIITTHLLTIITHIYTHRWRHVINNKALLFCSTQLGTALPSIQLHLQPTIISNSNTRMFGGVERRTHPNSDECGQQSLYSKPTNQRPWGLLPERITAVSEGIEPGSTNKPTITNLPNRGGVGFTPHYLDYI